MWRAYWRHECKDGAMDATQTDEPRSPILKITDRPNCRLCGVPMGLARWERIGPHFQPARKPVRRKRGLEALQLDLF